LLVVLVAAPGCSVRLGSRASLDAPLRAALDNRLPSRHAQTPAAGPAITRDYAERLQVGARVRVALRGGASFSATYMGVEGDAIRVQKRTRIPEPPIIIPLADLTLLALEQNGGGDQIWKPLLAGVAAGAGVFLTLLLIAVAAD
jgi:hypothetical protein